MDGRTYPDYRKASLKTFDLDIKELYAFILYVFSLFINILNNFKIRSRFS